MLHNTLDLMMIGLGVLGVFAALVALEYLTERSLERAVDNAMMRMRGAVMGISTIVLMLAVGMTELVFQAPELLIALLGIGSIIAGISWEVFGATAVVTYLVGAAVRGD